ncbi:MAG: helix-turn-helix domain-containing protein [Lachnospiraceae bacterium]|nr:helix-turn-helix domain-containing protein [Lachnospiraceae bacterium]
MNVSLREKEFINVKELADILGVSRSHAYELLNSDDCPFNAVKIGKKRIVIPTNSFYRWYDSLANANEQ